MKRIFFLAALLLAFIVNISASAHKLRFSLAGGYSMVNGIAGAGTFSWSPKISFSFPVSPKTHFINTELSIVSLYETQLTGSTLNTVGFGFGIRVFYNDLKFIRPYFNHEILTRVVFAGGRPGSARTFSVLLGLGADVPIEVSENEVSSLFADASYVFYDTPYFGTEGEKVKSIQLTAGYSLAF